VKTSNDQPSPKALTEVGRYGGYGLTLGLSTALFAWLGSLLDERLGTGPLFVLVGTFAGFGGGFYSMYRQLMHDTKPTNGTAGPEE